MRNIVYDISSIGTYHPSARIHSSTAYSPPGLVEQEAAAAPLSVPNMTPRLCIFCRSPVQGLDFSNMARW
jgi:hypothetical protein